MEDVLAVYARPYDSRYPVVCLDEMPRQLVAEIQPPQPARPGRLRRYDYEYQRQGVANVFMAFEPLQNWRHVEVTTRRTRQDWARLIRWLVDQRYPQATTVVLVQDNLNIHTLGSLYETFPAAEAWRLAQKLEIHYTPKHGSWLNMAEIELSVLEREGLDDRIASEDRLRQQGHAWARQRNAAGGGVNWQFRTPDARLKLRRLYPVIEA